MNSATNPADSATSIPPRPPRPAEPLWENFPDALTTRLQWVAWAYLFVKGRWTKVPLQPDGSAASTTDPATWASFEDVQCAYYSQLNGQTPFDGVGFVLSADDPFTGFDFDHCRNPDTEIDARIAGYITALDSYTEISPSGTGIRVLVKAKLPPKDRRIANIELYDSERFVSITGDVLMSREVEPRQEGVDAIHAEVFAKRIARRTQSHNGAQSHAHAGLFLDDAQIVEHASRARNANRFLALYRDGDHGNDHSAADLELMCMLLFWTQRDTSQAERIFGTSALGQRDKWSRRADYRARTIAAALDRVTEVYQPSPRNGDGHNNVDSNSTSTMAPDKDKNAASGSSTWNELAVVDRLLAKHNQDILYSKGLDYFVWDERRWLRDETEQVFRFAENVVRQIYAEAAGVLASAAGVTSKEEAQAIAKRATALEQLARAVSNRGRIEGALKSTRSHVAIIADELDADPHLLNVRNGTIDLRTGKLGAPHARADRITKLIDIDYLPGATAPRFKAFVDEIFAGDSSLSGYVKRSAGYSLTAEQKEKAFWFGCGPSDTGKTTFFNAMREVAGDYAQTVPVGLFLKDRNTIPADVARLRGVRFACASETAQGRSFDAEKLKWLTGLEGKLPARFMYREWFEFSPTHHLWLASNYRPHARADDSGLWNRLRLLPFTVIFVDPTEENPKPEHLKDKELLGKLLNERHGILAWAIEGAREWYEHGLDEPKCVKDAGAEYRSTEDTLKQFISKWVERRETEQTKKSDLFRAYSYFMEGEKNHLGKQHFNTALRDQYGFEEGHDATDGDVWLKTKLREGALPPRKEESTK